MLFLAVPVEITNEAVPHLSHFHEQPKQTPREEYKHITV